ncbi:MAG: DHHA1 domain-containing protein, partial [Candidatus Rifleibacteriota bacterium]
NNSAEIGLLTITSESSIAAGVRRIEAVSGSSALEIVHSLKQSERELTRLLDCEHKNLLHKAEKMVSENRELKRELDKLRKSQAMGKIDQIRAAARQISDVSVILSRTDDLNVDEMKELCDELVGNARGKTLALLATGGEKAGFVIKISKDLVQDGLHAGKIIKEVAKVAGGSGGGRPDMATAGGKDVEKIDEALAQAEQLISQALTR